MKKEKKLKKGCITTTKEVYKKVPQPKYKFMKEYFFHEFDNDKCETIAIILLSGADYCYDDGEWRYSLLNGGEVKESSLDKYIIK